MSKLKKESVCEEATFSSEDEGSISSARDSKALLKKFIEEETKLVKGKFRSVEVPGMSQKIFVRKFPPPVPPFEMVMEDGKQPKDYNMHYKMDGESLENMIFSILKQIL